MPIAFRPIYVQTESAFETSSSLTSPAQSGTRRPSKKRKKRALLGRDGKPLSPSAAKLRLLKRLKCTLRYEKVAWQSGARLIAGVDEVGRGWLFGPVVAAAVILRHDFDCEGKLRPCVRGLRDSKLLDAETREKLAVQIRQQAIAYAISAIDAAQIDQINIYHASRLAMREAVRQLSPVPDHLLVDAMVVDFDCTQTKIIHGDALSVSIAAASIIAKVERDNMVKQWDSVYPIYGLASNKGYSTPSHKAALREHGPSPLHRQSFAPVWMSSQTSFEFMEELEPEPEEELLEAVADAADDHSCG